MAEAETLLEGAAALWHYHLPGEDGAALCGEQRVMKRRIPLSMWMQVKRPGDVPASYCAKCERMRSDG